MIALRPAPGYAAPVVVDDFEDPSAWSVVSSDGARAWLEHDPGFNGRGLRIAFDMSAAGGWVLVRRSVALTLPENYAFTFRVRGEAPRNNLEFKLIDARTRNVWWRVLRDFTFPADWQLVTVRKSRLDFAWGPSKSRDLRQVGTIEFAVSAGEGGSGSVVIDDLTLEAREPVETNGAVPDVQAFTALPGHEPARMVDADPVTGWRSQPEPEDQWVMIDLRKNREFGGLVIDWDPDDYARAFEVQVSSDGFQWTTVYGTVTGHGGRSWIYMPDAESRYIRIDLHGSAHKRGYGIVGLTVKPFAFSASPDRFFAAIAADAPPGTYPKYLSGRQSYWTVVGVNGDDKEAIVNEEGMLEVDKGAFSIEPFLFTDGGLVTREQATITQQLDEGYLPIPSVIWDRQGLRLTVTVFAAGEPGAATLYARYRVENRGERSVPVDLFLAVRPFQVTPPWQSLNMSGGISRIQELRFDTEGVWVNQRLAVVPITRPDHAGAATFEEGPVTEFLLADRVPQRPRVSDPTGFASGALQYNFFLEPRGSAEVDLAMPFHAPPAAGGRAAPVGAAFVREQLERVRRSWRTMLGRVEIALPPGARDVTDTMRTTLAYILINRDGPAIRPGARNYARSWIRDGALTSTALLQMGFTREVREFLTWYARFQEEDGRVPCCIDGRGADPVLEHDSAGAFIYAVMEYYRYTRDVGFVADMWPHVARATDYLATLRRRRMTNEYRHEDKLAYFGLLPESISHEGYAAHPVHSYWDDFFALRGFKDAAEMAVVVGDDERAARYAALRDDFRTTLYASIERTVAAHRIDYLPGSVELGDFDPTSTSIAIAPGGELGNLPQPLLDRTYERYLGEVERRRRNESSWEQYTPYELRNVGTLVRLGRKGPALELLDWLLADRRPRAWNEWAEIAWRDPAAPHFIGDMPHTWVASGFITSVRTMLAYEREADRTLVVGEGVPAAWVTTEPGISVRRLPTHYGILNMTVRADGADAVRVRLWGDLGVPPGGIEVRSPLDRPLRAVELNGRPLEGHTAEAALVREWPAEVMLRYDGAAAASPAPPE